MHAVVYLQQFANLSCVIFVVFQTVVELMAIIKLALRLMPTIAM